MSALFRKIQKAEFNYPRFDIDRVHLFFNNGQCHLIRTLLYSWFSEEVRAMLDRILIVDPTQRISLPGLYHGLFNSIFFHLLPSLC